MVSSLNKLGDVALAMANCQEAKELYQQALKTAIDRQFLELSLDVLTGWATLLAREGDREGALELVALTLNHPGSSETTKDKARRLVGELQAELPPAVFAAAQERGQARDLDAAVAELLTELEE